MLKIYMSNWLPTGESHRLSEHQFINEETGAKMFDYDDIDKVFVKGSPNGYVSNGRISKSAVFVLKSGGNAYMTLGKTSASLPNGAILDKNECSVMQITRDGEMRDRLVYKGQPIGNIYSDADAPEAQAEVAGEDKHTSNLEERMSRLEDNFNKLFEIISKK